MDQAYSRVIVKSIDAEQRIISGIATSPATDLVGDVVEPRGAVYSLPLPLLLDHNHQQPVGQVLSAQASDKAITFRAKIAKVEEPGRVRDLTDEAWHSVRERLRASVSIGFTADPKGVERLPGGGLHYKKWTWLELSLVSVPANSEARIHEAKSAFEAACQIKQFDRGVVRLDRPPQIDQRAISEMAEIDAVANRMKKALDQIRAKDLTKPCSVALANTIATDTAAVLMVELVKLKRQVAELQSNGLKYMGVHQRALGYPRGAVITHSGAAWVALRSIEAGEDAPPSGGWQLMVKAGKDAR